MAFADRLCAQLRAHGRRLTPQRRAIIQTLAEVDSHPTAEQIFRRVRQTMPDISHATVYNTLHEMAEIGAIKELDLGLGERRYEVATTDHAHLVCLECGCTEDAPYDRAKLALSPEDAHGFEIIDCNVIYCGYCPACASRADDEGGAS